MCCSPLLFIPPDWGASAIAPQNAGPFLGNPADHRGNRSQQGSIRRKWGTLGAANAYEFTIARHTRKARYRDTRIDIQLNRLFSIATSNETILNQAECALFIIDQVRRAWDRIGSIIFRVFCYR
jgi:hypothetical protein